ncbi:MAG: glycosyltransferase family 2 protein [Clostridia bacterium]|nr:glycosyltransferase family 2 protein [Clostridia bacterium]
MKVLIIIPAYNEALNIEKTMTDLEKNASEFDYVIINDCSKDNTKEICEKNNFNVISLPVNYGLTSGIQIGMKYALANDYDIAIQFDGDGQHQAKYLKDLVKEIEENNCDVAVGSRFATKKKPFSIRMLGSSIIQLAIKLVTWKKITDPTSGMRAFNKKAIKEFVTNTSLTPEPDTLVYMIKKEMRVKEVQVEMSDREFGESYLNAFKSMEYMLSMMFSIIFIRAFTKKGGK